MYGPAAGLIPYDCAAVEAAAKASSALAAGTNDPAAATRRFNAPVPQTESGGLSHQDSATNCPSDRT
jgi:PPE-repeat protein